MLNSLFTVSQNPTLLLNLQRPSLQVIRIPSLILTLIMSRNKKRCVCEEIIHLFERQALGLRQEQIEEYGIGEVADDEDEVVFVANVRHGCRGYLADERVEGEGHHGGDRYTFGASTSIEHFGRDDPGERTACAGEGEVVEPGPNILSDIARYDCGLR